MTVFEKLFRYYPHKKDGFMYEFHYIEDSEDVDVLPRLKPAGFLGG